MAREPIILQKIAILPDLEIQLRRERWNGKDEDIWHVVDKGKRYGVVVSNDTANAQAFAVLLALQARFDGLNSQFAQFASRMLQLDQETENEQ